MMAVAGGEGVHVLSLYRQFNYIMALDIDILALKYILASLKYMRSFHADWRLQRNPKSRDRMGIAPEDGISRTLASRKYMRSCAQIGAPQGRA